jgi:hypothetical protein
MIPSVNPVGSHLCNILNSLPTELRSLSYSCTIKQRACHRIVSGLVTHVGKQLLTL